MVFPPVLAALLAVLATSTLALDEDFGFDVTDDLELEFSQEVAKKFWEMPDVRATVGHVFHLEIPRQTLGEIVKYDAKTTENQPLPSWLLFEKSGGVFWGVPTSHDVGSLNIVVTTIKKTDTVSKHFSLTIYEEVPKRPENCTASEDTTVLTLLIDRDVKAIKPKQRVVAINNIAKFFGLSYSAFKLEPLLEPDDITDSSVVLAGPGNSPSKNSKSISVIKVPVGCEARLWLNSAPLVHQLKQQARDGTISEVLGLPFVGWRVKTETPLIRNKRQTDGSGDFDDENYEYEYDNYDGEYDEIDNKPKPATTTATLTTPKTTTISSTRIDVATEHVSESHPHRHHHGEVDPILIDIESEDELVPESSTPPPKAAETTQRTTEVKPETTSVRPTSTAKTTVATTQSTSTSTTQASPVVTQPIYDGKYEDDYAYADYDEDDDVDSETEVPTLPVEKKTEMPKETTTVPTTTEAFITKIQAETVEFIPETTPTTTTSTTSTTMAPTTTTVSITTTPTTTTPTTTSTTTSTTTTETPTTTIKEITTTIEEETEPPTTIIVTETPSTTTTLPTTTEKLVTQEETTFKQTTLRHITTTTKPTTRMVTETIDFDVKNIPPQLQNRLKRVAVTAGKLFSFFIPEDTFSDLEDGKNLTLEFLDSEGGPVGKSSWCQFNPATKEIYGLPLEEDVSRWLYKIKATDKEGASTSDHLEIQVQHHKSRRAVSHEFSLYIQIEKKWEFPHLIDWPLKTLRALKTVYHLRNLSDITVRKVDYKSVPAVFSWTNDSLPNHICPKEAIEKIYHVMTANSDGDPSHSLLKALAPELRVKKVAFHGLGLCEPKPQPPQAPTHITPTNFSPVLRNPVDHINATIGELLVYHVPDDTFYDPEDVDPRNLKLTLLTADRQPIPSDHWLQFDSKNNEFYGIPLPDDAGPREYQLVCEDSGGLPASDSLIVVVHAPLSHIYNVEFRMTLETQYESFVHSANMQRKFVEKLQNLFEDKNTSYIHLSSISKGSTIVSWYNTSLSVDVCPRQEIKRLESILVNSDRTIASRVQYIMEPEFPVSAIQLQLIGTCKGRPSIQTPDIIDRPLDESSPQSGHDEYLITFIVPAVIIAAMLLLAGIAACVLYRRRRTGKMNVEEDGRASYGNKGIPVIFQEELEEKPESGTKAPVILKDEKPPLAPPEYSKSGSLKLTDDSEPYQPPPPFTRTQDNGRQARPKPTPTYRKPPPYVPP